MKQGTVSVLIGCHSQFHSYLVWRSWRKVFGEYPKFWEFVCIVIHDTGHWGKDYLTHNEEKMRHWELGARLAKKLYGQKGFDLCAGHCSYSNYIRSKMYFADKYSHYIAPTWWEYWISYIEPNTMSPGENRKEHIAKFTRMVKESVESGNWEDTHNIYLRIKEENKKK